MKRYQVVFLPEARLEALAAADYIANTSPSNAERWYQGLEQVIRRLEAMPRRCPRAPESIFLNDDLRHYVYKSHRIIFRVEEADGIVRILHIRHASRRAIGEPESED